MFIVEFYAPECWFYIFLRSIPATGTSLYIGVCHNFLFVYWGVINLILDYFSGYFKRTACVILNIKTNHLLLLLY